MDKIKVLIVDDHTVFRRGVAAALAAEEKLQVVGEASNGLEALAKAKQVNPEVILMDLNMPRCGGVEATQLIQKEVPSANILILTVSDKEEDLFSAIKAGAKGYLLKQTEPEELVQAVLHVAKGGVIVSSPLASTLLTEFKTAKVPAQEQESSNILSPRELDVLKLVAQGAGNKEIANTLVISENTVKTHLRNILDKLHLVNRSQAAAYAVRQRLAPPP